MIIASIDHLLREWRAWVFCAKINQRAAGEGGLWERNVLMKTSRRRVVLALGSSMLVPLLAGGALAQPASRADRAFEALGRRWLDRSMRYSPIAATSFRGNSENEIRFRSE